MKLFCPGWDELKGYMAFFTPDTIIASDPRRSSSNDASVAKMQLTRFCQYTANTKFMNTGNSAGSAASIKLEGRYLENQTS